jgi:hypothetical protein
MAALLSHSDHINLKGHFQLWRTRNGVSKLMVDKQNLYTNAGRVGLSNLLIGVGHEPEYVAIGTGIVAAVVGDTVLGTEVYRVAATRSQVTTTVANDTAQYVADTPIVGTHNITEAGLLSLVAAGVLFCRQVFTAVPVISGDIVRVTWKLSS